MNLTYPIKTAAVLATAAVFAVCSYAQDDAADDKPEAGAAASEQAADDTGVAAVKTADKFFYPLIRCVDASGTVQVLKPRTADWVDAVEGRYYPLGSIVRVIGDGKTPARAKFEFGDKSSLVAGEGVEFATKEIKIGDLNRTLVLRKGRVYLKLPLQLKEGFFSVESPNFKCENLAGESWFDYSAEADGDEAVLRCVTGSMALSGKHFKFPRLVAANQLRITTTGKGLFSVIKGESGDCKAQLDQGIIAERNFETGELVEKVKSLDFTLSAQCVIKIFRAKSNVGGRTVVSMMTFNATGDMKNRIAFAEGRANVNSGELVVSTKVAEADKAAKSSRVDEETETVEVKPAEEKKPAAPKKEEKKDDEDDLI